MSIKSVGGGRALSVFSTLALFCVFALLALSVLLFGARAYKSVAERMDDNYLYRTAMSYISNKVRQHDAAGAVTLSELNGIPALALAAGDAGGKYQTLIYYSNGAIRELFAAKGVSIDPDSGSEIVSAEGISFETSAGGLTVTIEGAGGDSEKLFLAIRSSGK